VAATTRVVYRCSSRLSRCPHRKPDPRACSGFSFWTFDRSGVDSKVAEQVQIAPSETCCKRAKRRDRRKSTRGLQEVASHDFNWTLTNGFRTCQSRRASPPRDVAAGHYTRMLTPAQVAIMTSPKKPCNIRMLPALVGAKHPAEQASQTGVEEKFATFPGQLRKGNRKMKSASYRVLTKEGRSWADFPVPILF